MLRGRRGRAEVAILTIVGEEFQAVQQVFGGMVNLPNSGYFKMPQETGKQHKLILRQSSARANLAAHQAVIDLVEEWRPPFILLCGIAGGVSTKDNLQLGDVVVPDFIHYAEISKVVDGTTQARYVPYDHPSLLIHECHVQAAIFDSQWRKYIPQLQRSETEPKVLSGSLIASEKLWGDPSNAEQRRLFETYSDAIAVDMESMGVARAVFSSRRNLNYNCQYLTVRGISDFVDAIDNDGLRKQWRPRAAVNAAAFARHISECLLASQGGIGSA
jgi:nucleoside phosphorylase